MRKARHAVVAAAVAAVVVGAAAPCPTAAADYVDLPVVRAKLDALPVNELAPKTGYDKALFGDKWSDDAVARDGFNGCDTRNDVLREQLNFVHVKHGTDGCVVLSGVLNDPYTGTTVDYERGPDSSNTIGIDRLVALSNAWRTGAQDLDEATRRNFANDTRNLQVTVAWINKDKADADAASWLPPNVDYRCQYVARIVEVKTAYRLWVTRPEHDAIAGVLASDC